MGVRLFTAIVRMEVRLFLRGFWLWAVIAALLAYLSFGYHVFFEKDMLGAGQLLQASSFIVMGCALVGMISGIIMAQREQAARFEEVLEALPGNTVRAFGKMTAWAIIVSMVMCMAIAYVLALYIMSGSQLILYWKMTVSYMLLYWGVTLLSGGILGYALERLIGSYWTYPVVFVIWILTSPYNTLLLPRRIAPVFNQGELDPNATYNDFQGLAVTSEAFFRHLLLLLLAGALFFLAALYRRLRELPHLEKRIYQGMAVVLLISGLSVIPLANQQSMLDVDKLFELNEKDWDFYKNQKRHLDSPAAFQVQKYKIALTHDQDRITYVADVLLDLSDYRQEWMDFTLYHGLQVKRVTAGGQDVEWRQAGDQVLVRQNPAVQSLALTFEISGNTGYKNPIDHHTFYLSSSFPWYPIPGNYTIGEINPERNLQMKNLELPYEVHFEVTVTETQQVYSNLPQKKHNQFAGTARGATLVLGRMLETYADGYRIVGPPDLLMQAPRVIPALRKEVAKMSHALGQQEPVLPKQIFLVPISWEVNVHAMEVTSDQLLLDAKAFRVFIDSPEAHFASAREVFLAFFWHNQYREVDGIAPIFLAALYDHLHSVDKKRSHLTWIAELDYPPEYSEMVKAKELAKQYIQLAEKQRDELMDKLPDWYDAVTKGNVGLDLFHDYLKHAKK